MVDLASVSDKFQNLKKGFVLNHPNSTMVPPIDLSALGDKRFCEEYGVKYPYMAGAMAQGIASPRLVRAMADAGLLASYGAAGLSLERIEAELQSLCRELKGRPFAVNLIHTPSEQDWEMGLVRLLHELKISIVEASAFMKLTEAVVFYKVAGMNRLSDGTIYSPNRIIAKVSRREVAEKFMSPAPEKILVSLVSKGLISQEEAALARQVPLACDVTAEADSGGHTDNRPALTLIPTLISLSAKIRSKFGFKDSCRVGAAGGLGTPESLAAVFAMGAAYVVTGTINQACVESGTSDLARQMLADAKQADIAMAPAADMFEMGIKVQVLKRGTLFAMRGQKLYEIYRSCGGIQDLTPEQRGLLEKQYFGRSIEAEWASTEAFFQKRDPGQVERANRDPKHKLALLFRSYLGQASLWAKQGLKNRAVDFQIWCGPAMGAFNSWVEGSFLASPEERRVVVVALNLLYGAALVQRAQTIRAQGGAHLSPSPFKPLPKDDILNAIDSGVSL